MKRIEILYENELCLVLYKPAGLAAQGGTGLGISVDSILAETYSPRPLLVHRLDRDTSGVMLVAKTKAAAAFCSRLLGEGRAGSGIIKRYLAVCAGRPAGDSGVISLDLEMRGGPKRSETFFKVQGSGELEGLRFSLLELELGTGRTHQIRRHLAMTGNPVLGDDKYGDFSLNKKLRKTIKLKQLLLHASRLIIPPQPGGFQLDVTAPLPEYFGVLVSAKKDLTRGHGGTEGGA